MKKLKMISLLLFAVCQFLLVSCASPELVSEPGEEIPLPSEADEQADPLTQVADLRGQPVLLEASLDDGVIDGFEIIEGEWQLTEAQDGNVVAEIDNRDGASNPAFQIGDADWANYSLNYRFKYLSDSVEGSEIYINFHISESGPYQVAMGMGENAYVVLGHIPNANSWNTLAEETANLAPDEWHDLRLDVSGGEISLLLDGDLVFSVTDDSSSAGIIEMGVGAGTHAQFDDFLVVSLDGAQQVAVNSSQGESSQEMPSEEDSVADDSGDDDVEENDQQTETGITEIIIDGQADDWEGRQLLQTDEQGDGDFDLLAGYAFVNQDALYFMIEVADPSAYLIQFDLKFQANNRRILISWTPGQNGFMSDITTNFESLGETSLSSFELGSILEARVDLEELGSPKLINLLEVDVWFGDGGEDNDNLHFDGHTPVVNEIDSTERSVAGRSPAELEYDAGVVAVVVGSHEGELLTDQTWVRLGGPQGGLGYDIRMHLENPAIMYVTDAWAGVHKSIDGGFTWFSINEGINARTGPSGDAIPAFSLTIDPNDPEIIWAGMTGQRGVYRSPDGGATWQEYSNGIVEDHGLTIRTIAVEPGNSDVVYVAGEIDSSLWAGEPQWGIGFDRTQGVVYKSTNSGQNWQAIWRGDNLVRYVLIDPTDVNILYIASGVFDREAANSDPNTLSPGGVGVLKSLDGGETWFEINTGLENLYIVSLIIHPQDSQTLLAASHNVTYREGNAAYVTRNGGVSWEKIIEDDGLNSVEIFPEDPNIWYVIGDSLYISRDNGHTWERRNSQGSTSWRPSRMSAGVAMDLLVDTKNPDRLFVNNYGGGNFLTEDGGTSWISASTGYTGAEIWDVSVHPQNPAIVYVNGRSGPSVSTDGGIIWQGITPAGGRIQDGPTISIDPQNPLHILAAEAQQAQIYESWDGGANWEFIYEDCDRLCGLPTHIQTGPYSLSFAPSDPSIVYGGFGTWGCLSDREGSACDAEAAFSVQISSDGGHTWEELIDLPFQGASVSRIVVHPEDANTAWAAAAGDGVFITIDGGKSWEDRSAGLDSKLIMDLAVDHQNPNVLYAATSNGGVFKSEDGGLTWSRRSTGMDPNERVSAIVVDPVRPEVVYAGTKFSGVYLSKDGGISWRLLNDGLRTRAVFSLDISPDGSTLYAGTQGEGVFRLSTLSQEEFDSLVGP